MDEQNIARQLRARDVKRLRLADVLRREAENDNPPRADAQDAPRFSCGASPLSPAGAPLSIMRKSRASTPRRSQRTARPHSRGRSEVFDVGYPSPGQRSTAAKMGGKSAPAGILVPHRTKKGRKCPSRCSCLRPHGPTGATVSGFRAPGETQFCLWQACPDNADLATLNAAVQGDLGGERLARVIIRHFGYQLSPAEENLLARWLAEDTGPDFWEVVRKEGLYYDRKEDDSDEQG